MKITKHVSVSGDGSTVYVTKDDTTLYLSVSETRALALSLARASANPRGLAADELEGVEHLRELARELDAEADRRAARAEAASP